ncbi:MAG: hypothetical protein ACK5N4_16550 [Parabacteroides gordonii]
MTAAAVFSGCGNYFWWLPQQNKLAAAAIFSYLGGRWGSKKAVLKTL